MFGAAQLITQSGIGISFRRSTRGRPGLSTGRTCSQVRLRWYRMGREKSGSFDLEVYLDMKFESWLSSAHTS